jgi:hypothetical protein
MTKQSDPSAGGFETEKTGLMSGLFAEENELGRRALWRIGGWGAAAVGAVILAVMSNQWSLGLRREQVAAADLARQAQQIQSLAKESQNETRRLASAIETLNGDRDRLFSRVTVIEQGLDSVTGALAKQTTPAAPQASNTPPTSSSSGAPQAAAPVPAPVTTTAAASPATDKPRTDAGKPDAATTAASANPAAPANGQTASPTASIQPPPASPATAASLMARSMMGPPDPAAPKLIETPKMADAKPADTKPADAKSADMKPADMKSVDAKLADTKSAEMKPAEMKPTDGKTANGKTADPKVAETKGSDAKIIDAKAADVPPAPVPASPAAEVVASTNSDEEADAAETPNVTVKRTDFAVDLGSANSLGGLRALWRGVRYLNAELGALSPIIVIREGTTGLGMQLHLAAGPLRDAAAAAKICAVLAERKRPCETTVYDGQKLATKEGEPQPLASIKPAAPSDAKTAGSRHGSYKHAGRKEEPPPPPPPESTSTFSSLFGRK